MSADVCVVGGGPAGLAAAIAARQRGLSVVVADLLRPPIDRACGEGLMPDAVEDLARLGIEVAEMPHGEFRGIRFVSAGHSADAAFPRGAGAGVRRTTLHAALAERAERAGATLRWGARVDGIRGGGVAVDGDVIRCRWVVGADGKGSRVRRWAGLLPEKEFGRRFALRRHFASAPPDHVEIHWGEASQAYVTPVGPREVGVAIITRAKPAGFDEELGRIPTLGERLRDARATSSVRGSETISNRLRRVAAAGVALIGDASGSVDAITGEGLALAFRQAQALADALAAEELSRYEAAHRQIMALPRRMARAMLLLDQSALVRRRALRVFAAKPNLFARMLAVHVGELSLKGFGAAAYADFGWRMLTARG